MVGDELRGSARSRRVSSADFVSTGTRLAVRTSLREQSSPSSCLSWKRVTAVLGVLHPVKMQFYTGSVMSRVTAVLGVLHPVKMQLYTGSVGCTSSCKDAALHW
jgi:hypothetical protein